MAEMNRRRNPFACPSQWGDDFPDRFRKLEWANARRVAFLGLGLFIVPWLVVYFASKPSLLVALLMFVSLAGLLVFTAVLVGQFSERRDEQLRRLDPSLTEIRRLKWQDFENFVAAVLRAKGYAVEPFNSDPKREAQPDGGIDLIVRKGERVVYVQTKQYLHERIGVRPVRELLGVARRDAIKECWFVTSGAFTQEARQEFAGREDVTLVDGEQLVAWLDEVREEISEGSQSVQNLRDIALALMPQDYLPLHRCPRCQRVMVLIDSAKMQKRIWACPAWKRGCEGHVLDLNEFERDLLVRRVDPVRVTLGPRQP